MGLYFQSVMSGSSGNCALLWTGKTTILIDAGFHSQEGLREMIGHLLPQINGLIVSHLHWDHIDYPALRVLEESGVPVYVCKGDTEFLLEKHSNGYAFRELDVRPFSDETFRIGDFSIKPFEVPHAPECHTFGFEISCQQRGRKRKVVHATDLSHWRGLRGYFENADFIYLEANHDPGLLQSYPNFRSRYHLRNQDSAWLLRRAFDNSGQYPVGVMLGHLSARRNEPSLALDTVGAILDEGGHGDVEVTVAPRSEPSDAIRII